MTFIVVPMKGQSLKMHTVLQSIALLDSQFTKVNIRATHHRFFCC